MTNLYKCISDWLAEYPSLYSWLYFNATQMLTDNVSVNSVMGNRVKETFIDGSYVSELSFALTLVKAHDFETSSTNLEAINEIEHFMLWIEDNMDKLVFGEGYIITDVEVMNNVPNIVIDTEQNLAKYQFNATVTYIKNI